jgi:hypothetical protein
VDLEEIDAACQRIANGTEYLEYLRWSVSRGAENGCTIIGFDTPENAAEMQAWINANGIADRPPPESAPNQRPIRFASV